MHEQIGWTGTRSLDNKGRAYIIRILRRYRTRRPIIITGACIGTDAFVARQAMLLGYWVHTIVPANRMQVDPEWRMYCDSFEEMPKDTNYRDRNERIVDLSQWLHAVADWPENYSASRRSGTWMTVRIARKRNIDVRMYVQNKGKYW